MRPLLGYCRITALDIKPLGATQAAFFVDLLALGLYEAAFRPVLQVVTAGAAVTASGEPGTRIPIAVPCACRRRSADAEDRISRPNCLRDLCCVICLGCVSWPGKYAVFGQCRGS